jgi:hypothetical protein
MEAEDINTELPGGRRMNERFLMIDAASVRAKIEELRNAFPELEDDAGLFSDMIEGETNLHELVERAVEMKLDADEMANAIKGRIDAHEVRRKRFQEKSEGLKGIIKHLLEIANQKTLVLPSATVSITKPRERTIIWAEEELPQGYFKLERKPDTTAITAALKAGNEIPGAALEVGQPGLTIRTK